MAIKNRSIEQGQGFQVTDPYRHVEAQHRAKPRAEVVREENKAKDNQVSEEGVIPTMPYENEAWKLSLRDTEILIAAMENPSKPSKELLSMF